MPRPTLRNIKALENSLKVYNIMSRSYKLGVKFPENVNWNMDMEEYNTHMKTLEKIMKHPYKVSKSEIHPCNK